MKIRIAIFCVLSLGLSSIAGAQTLKAYLEAAEEAKKEKDYYSAYIYYGTALEIDSSNKDVRYEMADAARNYQAYEVAEGLYSTVVDEVAGYGDAAFWLAYCQHIQGKYDTAIASYQIYLSEAVQDDDPLIQRAELGITQCQWALEQDTTKSDSIVVEKLDSTVNTNFSEVAALKHDEILYFSRLGFERRDKVKKKEVPPAYLYSKVLAAEEDSLAVPLDSTLNDTVKHTAHTTFNHDGTRVFYTLCRYLNRYDIRCDLYFKDIDPETGEWGEAQKLPEPINSNEFTSTQPSIAYDDLISKEVLYFVSDRREGQGGLDIW